MKLLQPSRPVAVVAVFVILVAMVDFLSRVFVWRETPPKRVAEVVNGPVAGDSSEVILKRLSGWIPLASDRPDSPRFSPDDLRLQAVFVRRQGAQAIVALLDTTNGQISRYLRVSPGDDVNGWRILEINSRKLVLERDGSTFELALFRRERAPAEEVK